MSGDEDGAPGAPRKTGTLLQWGIRRRLDADWSASWEDGDKTGGLAVTLALQGVPVASAGEKAFTEPWRHALSLAEEGEVEPLVSMLLIAATPRAEGRPQTAIPPPVMQWLCRQIIERPPVKRGAPRAVSPSELLHWRDKYQRAPHGTRKRVLLEFIIEYRLSYERAKKLLQPGVTSSDR